MIEPHYTLAIVGLGPRGHYALENFLVGLKNLSPAQDVKIALFEGSDQPGNGPVWDTSQSSSNWSNVNERILLLPQRDEIQLGSTHVAAFPSYHEWKGCNPDNRDAQQADYYPPRPTVGTYLNARFASLVTPLLQSGIATMITETVDDLTLGDHGVSISTEAGDRYTADQALLAVGHQPTQLDPQLKDWMATIDPASAATLITAPYPVAQVIDSLHGKTEIAVAIRGYGLATIDVARAIAQEYGTFSIQDTHTCTQSFSLTRDVSLHLVPFSLDGLPMGPKPLNNNIDLQFKPSSDALDDLNKRLSSPEQQAAAQDETFLLDALVPVIATVYRSLAQKSGTAPSDDSDLMHLIRQWIDDPSTDHSCITSVQTSPVALLQTLVDMAIGAAPISLDYCIGQVWRHCHATIYTSLSHSALSDDVLAKCIFLDESQKRYSFGPPVESLQQLIALHQAGVLNLDYLSDPDIDVSKSGWALSNGSDQTSATMMVNAVLDAPKIKDVNSPLMQNLLTNGVLAPVHDDLGVTTLPDGFIMSDTGKPMPIAVLGRLAKGTIIGVDAILECFGQRPQDWANAAVDRVRQGDASSTT